MMFNCKKRDDYMLCSDCGYAVKRSKMFIKSYKHTAVCLCKKCAKKLADEINVKYTEEGE